jgi:formylglycine-generating enzyme required for sulfatase activity
MAAMTLVGRAQLRAGADAARRRLAHAGVVSSSLLLACQQRSEPASLVTTHAASPALAAAAGSPPAAGAKPSAAGKPSAAAVAPATAAAPSTASVVAVPAGSVTKQGRRINVPAFYMDRTEVTVREYLACVGIGRCTATLTDGLCNAGQPQKKGDHPINCVTQLQAASFCAARGARLPTEPEWQLAAAGAEGRIYPWGSELPSLLWVTEPKNGAYAPGPARHHLCWMGDGTSEEVYPQSTCPVASHHAGDTPSGISDLAGNVWEWTSDEQGAGADPLFILKGGGYGYDRMGALEVRATDSSQHEADFYGPDIGFRCVQAGPTAQR